MNDEIKEILIFIENKIYPKDSLLFEKWSFLKDYITNLQKENEEWTMIFDTFSKRPYAHKYLEEKRKELGNDKIIGLDSEMIYKDYYDYKSRIEKAVEYIKEHPCDTWYYTKKKSKKMWDIEIIRCDKELLNILQNGSENNESN